MDSIGWSKNSIIWGLIPLLLLFTRDVLGFYTPYQAAQAHDRALHNAQTTDDQAPYEFKIHHVLEDPAGKQAGVEVERGLKTEDPAPFEFRIHKVREDPSEKQSWDGIQKPHIREQEKQFGALGLALQGSQNTEPPKQSQLQGVGLEDVEVSQYSKTSSPSDDEFLEQPTFVSSENEQPTQSSLAVANNYYYFTMCDYGGEKFPVGSFRPDPCTDCHCNATTGRVTCTAQACPPIPNCIEFALTPTPGDTCCQPCAKVGCYYKGRAYPAGAKIDSGACEKCYCPWEGGDPETGAPTCMTIECPPPRCVDADVPTDKCCPVCPNGE
jgi:hypothetical protein